MRAWLAILGTALLATACGGSADAPPHVLLITVDTLRADRLGVYGYPLPTSPAIDRLAARGVRFADASVAWPKTWPSMAALMTGAHPKTTGIKLQPRALPEAHLLLAEVFRAHGYRTGAVVANFNVGRHLGFDQGFDHFVESWQEAWAKQAGEVDFVNAPGRVKLFTDARTVTDQGLAWLRASDPGKPFFLWLHYMDPHGPYVPPPSYADEFAGHHPPEPVPLAAIPSYQLQRRADGTPITDLAHYRAQYDREVRYLDDEVDRLLREIEASGVEARRLLVAFSADHGESFDEHGYHLEHGLLPYQPTAHVPLLLVHEGRLPAGRVVEAPVGLVDLSPTLLDLAGIEVPATFEGRSLRALVETGDAAVAPEHVFMESGYERETQLVVRRGKWKLVHVRSPAERRLMTGATYELYDLERDPGETENVADRHPALVSELSAALAGWFESGPRWATGEALDLERLSAEEREMLRALGYLDEE